MILLDTTRTRTILPGGDPVKNFGNLSGILAGRCPARINKALLSPYAGNFFKHAILDREEQIAGAHGSRGLSCRQHIVRNCHVRIVAHVHCERLSLLVETTFVAVRGHPGDQADRRLIVEPGSLEVLQRRYLKHGLTFCSATFQNRTVYRRQDELSGVSFGDKHSEIYISLRMARTLVEARCSNNSGRFTDLSTIAINNSREPGKSVNGKTFFG